MKTLVRIAAGCLLAALLGACATANEAYYSALKADLEARSRTEVARLDADRARLTAIAQIAATGGESAKTAAVLALALHGSGGGAAPAPQASVPAPPRSGGEQLWTAFLQVADVGLRAWGIKVGSDVAIRQSDNAANTAIASYGAFQAMGGQIRDAGIAGYPFVQSPQANVTLSGTGVIGSGSYVGPVTTTRTCTGGPAGDGAGTTTGAPGGAGGPASC